MVRPPDWRSGFTARIMEARDPAVTLYLTTRDAPDAPLIFYIRLKHGLWTRSTDGVLLADGWTGPDDQAYGDGIPEAEEYRRTASTWDQAVTEAWILARLTDEEVAAKVGLRPAAVMWYERLFFHVRDRLDCDGYIRAVIKNWALKPIPGDVVKQYGYFAGQGTLDIVLKHWDGNPRPVFDPADLIRDPVTARERLSALLSVMCRLLPMKVGTNDREFRELLRMKAQFDSLHRPTPEAAQPEASGWTAYFGKEPKGPVPTEKPSEVAPEPIVNAVCPTPVLLTLRSGASRRAQQRAASPV
jgi:hypothetical protein